MEVSKGIIDLGIFRSPYKRIGNCELLWGMVFHVDNEVTQNDSESTEITYLCGSKTTYLS